MATLHLHVNLTYFVFQSRLACFRGSLKNKATDSGDLIIPLYGITIFVLQIRTIFTKNHNEYISKKPRT